MKIILLPLCLAALAASAQADPVRLHIIGPDKKPVVGAQVLIGEYQGINNMSKAQLTRLVSDAQGIVVHETEFPMLPLQGEEKFTKENRLAARILAPGLVVAQKTLRSGDNEVVMEAGRSWGGQVFDEAQQPVEGVRIVLKGSSAELTNTTELWPRAFQQESTTDKAGKWNFEGVPPTGWVRVEIDSPRYVREAWAFPLDAATAPPLYIERGATIKGRLLKPDGQAAADVPLTPGGMDFSFYDDNYFQTAADGTFEITGLPAGTYYLQKNNFLGAGPLPFIIEPKNVAVKTGEVRDIGDWKAAKGIQLVGKIVEKGTNKPVSSARVSAGMGNAIAQPDEKGSFSVLVEEDDLRWISLMAPGFVLPDLRAGGVVNGIVNLGTIELKRGVSITGMVKDRNQKGISGVSLLVRRGNVQKQYIISDPTGKFTLEGLDAGTYSLRAQKGKTAKDVKITILPNQKPAPIEVQLDVTEVANDESRKAINGRVIDPEGNPVAGAKIEIRLDDPDRSYQKTKAISGADGSFKAMWQYEQGPLVIGRAKRPGFTFVRADQSQWTNGTWNTTVVLQPQGTALRGQVLDALGRPAPRAYVSLAGSNTQPMVQADEKGVFALSDVPLEGVTVLASNGIGFGETKVEKADGPVQVTLREVAGEDATRQALIDELLPQAGLEYLADGDWNRYWKMLGTERFEKAVSNSKQDWFWTQYLNMLAEREPKTFLDRLDQLLLPTTKGDLQIDLLVVRTQALSDDPAHRAKAQAWLEAHSRPSLEITSSSVRDLLRTARIAEAFQAGGGTKWVDFAAQIAAQLPDKGILAEAEVWGMNVAPVGLPALENLIQDWGALAQLQAYSGASQFFSRTGDLKNTGAMLKRMEEILPEAQKSKDRVVLEGFERQPKDLLQSARSSYAKQLVETDPALAFEMTSNVPDFEKSTLLIAIGKTLAKQGQKEAAEKALREVFNSKLSNVEWYPQAAEVALEFDPKLADELFQMAWERTKPFLDSSPQSYRASTESYAGARARNWPGESRILIEREWAQRLPSFNADDRENVYQNAANLKSLIAAMAGIAPRRAMEMAGKLPEYQDMRAEARGRILIKLVERQQ